MNKTSGNAATTRELIETTVRILDGEAVSDDEQQQVLLADDSEFIAFLNYHRIGAVLNQYLSGTFETHIGREAIEVASDLEEFRLVAEQISAAFERDRIPYAFLKGTQLLETVYKSKPVRPMGDVDLLVSKQDVSRACSILEELGCGYPKRQIGAWFLRRFHYEITMQRGAVDIDVHWGLDHPLTLYPVSTEELLNSADEFSVGKTSANGVSTEHMLVHLILHLDRESNLSVLERGGGDRLDVLQQAQVEDWPYLIRVLDIVQLLSVNAATFESGGLLRILRSHGIDTPSLYALDLCRLLFPRSMWRWSDQIDQLSEPRRFGIAKIAKLVDSTVGNRHLAGLNMRPIRILTLIELLLLGTNQSASRTRKDAVRGVVSMPKRLGEVLVRIAWGGFWAVLGSVAKSLR